MVFLAAMFGLIGLVLLVGTFIGWQMQRLSGNPAPEQDLATPYRQGLHAAVRMQAVAQDLEQQIYAEAMRHTKDNPGIGRS